VDQALEEPPLGMLGRRPDLFENFMAIIELTAIKQLDTQVEEYLRILLHLQPRLSER
jgi:hypothetical protein